MTADEYWNSEGIRFLNDDGTTPTVEERVKEGFKRGAECSSFEFKNKTQDLWDELHSITDILGAGIPVLDPDSGVTPSDLVRTLNNEVARLREENDELKLSEAALSEQLKISDDWLKQTRNEVARLSCIPLPCPFCGKKLNEDDVYMNLVSYYHYVRCRKKSCLAEGPARKSWDGAVKAWNKCKAIK